MKFDCGETYEEKLKRLATPHKWFAWYPVKIDDHDCRWMEFVERTIVISWWLGHKFVKKTYRPLDSKK